MQRTKEQRFLKYIFFKESFDLDKLKLSILSGNPDKKLLHSNPKYLKQRTYPAVDLENQLGFNGISQEYKMPFGLTNIETENIAIIFQKDEDVIKFLYYQMKKLNPELPDVYNTEKMYDVIGGAFSKYNSDDIKDYIENYIENEYKIDKESSTMDLRRLFNRKNDKIAYDLMWNKIADLGLKPNWFPSIKTLNYIYQKLKQTI